MNIIRWSEFVREELKFFSEAAELTKILSWIHIKYPQFTITHNDTKDDDHINIKLEHNPDSTHKTLINLEIHVDKNDYYHVKICGKSGEFSTNIEGYDKTWHNFKLIDCSAISHDDITYIEQFIQNNLDKYLN